MRTDILENKDLIINLINNNTPKSEICRILNCKETTLDSYLLKMNIVYKGNKGRKGYNHYEQRKESMYYIENKKKIGSHKLKRKLIEDKIKEHKCEICKLKEWQGVLIPIELHHIDGDRFNNNLDNLQILCPNCHALTDNHAGKNTRKIRENIIKVKEKEKKGIKFICICGKEIYKRSKMCKGCSILSMRKVERPDYETLLEEIKEFGYEGTGIKYGITGNGIRKWKINYEKTPL